MLSASAMELFNIVVLKEKVEDVALSLLKLGIFHPVDISNIEEELKRLSPIEIAKEYSELELLESKSRDIPRKLNISISPIYKDVKAFSYDTINKTLADMEARVSPLLTQKEELEIDLKTKESIFSQIKGVPLLLLKRDSMYSFLEVSMGRIDEKNAGLLENGLKDIPHIMYPFKKESGKLIGLFIGLKRDRVFIERVLRNLAWEKIEYPSLDKNLAKDMETRLSEQIEEQKKKIQGISAQIKEKGEGFKADLSGIHSFIILKKSLLETKRYSYATEKTVLISGWVPKDEREKVITAIKRIDPLAYLDVRSPEEINIPKEDIPVRLKHNAFFKPFELLIQSYGIPRYGSIDPTIFVAVSFLLMFGAMFGDLGHGLILTILALLLRRSKNKTVKQASALIFYCGVSSAIFGILYGSFFGWEFPSVWIKPMSNILGIFKVSIVFGIGVISLGILVNVINALRDKDYLKALFDKAGLIVGVFYWLAIALVSKKFISKINPPAIYLTLIFTCLLFLFFKPIIEFICKKEKKNLLVALIESMVDILEVIMGYLANTISFIRIAAFSLAHAGLFIAIFELSRIVNNQGGAFLSFLVVILGNGLIILLEGLVVSIQSLRLNYYEFFSKFFVAGKKEYKPVTTSPTA